MEEVVLVNEFDEQIGIMEKMEAHEKALLHRAFSICVFNNNNELLLQQRAEEKYHSGGLWTNTCCSHPRPGETLLAAGHRRLLEEMGFDCELNPAFHFVYQAVLDKGLTEHELDHVIIGKYEGEPLPNPDEVMNYKWMSLEQITVDMKTNPYEYTEWFKICFQELAEYMLQKK
jgi:isopentenyl-diphosphate delta-isomerase